MKGAFKRGTEEEKGFSQWIYSSDRMPDLNAESIFSLALIASATGAGEMSAMPTPVRSLPAIPGRLRAYKSPVQLVEKVDIKRGKYYKIPLFESRSSFLSLAGILEF